MKTICYNQVALGTTESCSVCLDHLGDDAVTTRCEHVFCASCIRTWCADGPNTCPLCRAPAPLSISISGMLSIDLGRSKITGIETRSRRLLYWMGRKRVSTTLNIDEDTLFFAAGGHRFLQWHCTQVARFCSDPTTLTLWARPDEGRPVRPYTVTFCRPGMVEAVGATIRLWFDTCNRRLNEE